MEAEAEEETVLRPRRQRREPTGRRAALEQLQAAKRRGEKHKPTIGEAPERVYDEVDDESYSDLVRSRQRDNWIVDDGTGGYADDGREIFDVEEGDEYSGATKAGSRDGGKSKNASASSRPAKRPLGIANYFSAAAKPVDEATISISGDSALDSLLSELDAKPAGGHSSAVSRPTVGGAARPSSRHVNPFMVSRPQKREPSSPLKAPSPIKPKPTKLRRNDVAPSSPNRVSPPLPVAVERPSSPVVENGFPAPDDTAESLEAPEVLCHEAAEPIQAESGDTVGQHMHHFEKLPLNAVVSEMASFGVCELAESAPLVEMSANSGDSALPVLTGADGKEYLNFFWLDAHEDARNTHPQNQGTVHLFGRVVDASGEWSSCCVVVRRIERVLQLILRADTDEDVSNVAMSAYSEFLAAFESRFSCPGERRLMRCKPTKKKCALDGGAEPRQVDCLEVRYPSKYPLWPSSDSGKYYERVCGATSTALEQLLLQLRLRGPGWLRINEPTAVSAKVSRCRHEVCVEAADGFSDAIQLGDFDAAVKVCVLAVNLVTVPHPQNRLPEIVAASLLVQRRAPLDRPTSFQEFTESYCVVTKAANTVVPFDFAEMMKKERRGNVRVMGNERSLLNFLLNRIEHIDPDFIVGHDLHSFGLDTLLHRMQTHKLHNWSVLSRLRRRGAPPKLRSRAAAAELTAGRLVVDAASAAKELKRCRSYDLSELCAQIVAVERADPSVDDILQAYESSAGLVKLLAWVCTDAQLCLRLVDALSAVPLYMQISQIVGGILSHTLLGGRSERNEFLLLHAFYEHDFLCPDKRSAKDRMAVKTEESVEQGDGGKKKVGYTGGLVLDPVKGLYNTYILLLDFNSLYPSIIQEFNICFTTVDQSNCLANDVCHCQFLFFWFCGMGLGELFTVGLKGAVRALPEMPATTLSQGILPAEIRKLVDSRREVKKLMKAPTLSPAERAKYDIRQLALKLTANSMYGCLGFAHSRFYAKPLAALVTAKGREILMHTKELVERRGLQVIYGDTDSIMINTNTQNYDDVLGLGKQVKADVNKLYRLVELDVDGVYEQLLLLKKKKYAGVAIDEHRTRRREMKGLDIVRRDWSGLAKTAGNFVLDRIFEEKSADDFLPKIHDYLRQLRADVEGGQVALDDYQISKQLTRSPTDYADGASLPHVSVALRLNATGAFHLKHGDTVSYVICDDGSSQPAVKRAYHISEQPNGNPLKIDSHYYLAQQVMPVVSRLCEPIQGTDTAQMAECLGLDSASYRKQMAAARSADGDDDVVGVNDQVDFANVEPFALRCFNPDCDGATPCQVTAALVAYLASSSRPTAPPLQQADGRPTLAACAQCGASPARMLPLLVNHLQKKIRQHIADYYAAWWRCADATCAHRTRRPPFRFDGTAPRCPVCKQDQLVAEVSEKSLVSQLCFYKRLFDLPSAIDQLSATTQKTVNANLPAELKVAYEELFKCADDALSHSTFSQIKLSSIFFFYLDK